MNDKVKNIIFEKHFENENMGILIIHKREVEYLNNAFKRIAKLFDVNLEEISPLEIYFDYKNYVKIKSDITKLHNLMDYINIFQNANNEISFKDVKEFKERYIEIGFEGVIIENEKYYVITVLDVTNEIKLLDYKYLEISKKISEISFKELSKLNFNSRRTYEKIFNVLKEYDIIKEIAIATLKDKNKIYIEFGIIDDIVLTGKEFLRSNKTLTSYVIDYNKKIYISDSLNYELPYGYKIHHVGARPKPYSVYGVPLKDENDEVYGAILYERPKNDRFTKLEFALLDEITYAIQSVIRFNNLYRELYQEKEKYYEMSIKDHLTKAYNRNFLGEYLKKIYEQSKRYGDLITISFIDIDDFKMINDIYGHDYGDMCLILFSEVVNENIRESDIFARYGGDEFIIIFPNTNIEDSKKIMNRIKEKLKHSEFPISISFGITELDETITLTENLKKVDTLMYEMKKTKKC
ncbi:sensor domain-containing diguanylate cyclase [Marinitoga aeolica]|uniref:GGDEF domain-containing protein n=1 Tax=Marinitoga aeolica TaxID=2809031 RepID=A0ABY8PSE8_9BACT|nr:GGDEF domain-containing protein [Marinitoga aeolica]WGS65545.1 GGDEF domain-containing protein [Marinitoga aeolica]